MWEGGVLTDASHRVFDGPLEDTVWCFPSAVGHHDAVGSSTGELINDGLSCASAGACYYNVLPRAVHDVAYLVSSIRSASPRLSSAPGLESESNNFGRRHR
jgi:hypothetical protein